MHPGLRFVGETRLGPLHFADRMVVERADAPTATHPGHLVVEKFGPVAGRVEATVEQVPTGTLVIWRQSLRPAWLPKVLRPFGAMFARIAYGAGLRQIVRWLRQPLVESKNLTKRAFVKSIVPLRLCRPYRAGGREATGP